jgi:hypothetical protein
LIAHKKLFYKDPSPARKNDALNLWFFGQKEPFWDSNHEEMQGVNKETGV